MNSTIDPSSAPTGPALLSLGFRPFFLLAGAYALVAMAVWTYDYASGPTLRTHYGPVNWHSHEMLFGYAAAVIAGFLLTAVPNWTGLPAARGPHLGALAVLWLAGRIAGFAPAALPPVLVALIDLAFWPALALTLGRPLWRSGQKQNLIFIPILTLMLIANAAVHFQVLGWSESSARAGVESMLFLVVMIMVLIGGRVIPFFTERALPPVAVTRHPWLDRLAVASVIATYLVLQIAPASYLLAAVAGAAALIHWLRLSGWWVRGVASAPLLWVLHCGYGWIGVGFALMALGAIGPVPWTGAIHAFTGGAIGSLTLGMMARVALGHTGRPLTVDGAMVVAFVLVNLAAVVRVGASALDILYTGGILVAGVLWCAAFALFLARYTPILFAPRLDGS